MASHPPSHPQVELQTALDAPRIGSWPRIYSIYSTYSIYSIYSIYSQESRIKGTLKPR